MTRHPASDERSVLGPPAKPVKGERFFVKEMAPFLRVTPAAVKKFLRREGLLRKLGMGTGRDGAFYTGARGLALLVAHFRAIQGAEYQRGKDPLREKDLNTAKARRRVARLRGSG